MWHSFFLYSLMTLPACKQPLHPVLFCWETFAAHLSCIAPCRMCRCHPQFYFVSTSLCCKVSSISRCLFQEASSFLHLLPLHPKSVFLHHIFLPMDAAAEWCF